jgi:hypothetical protein
MSNFCSSPAEPGASLGGYRHKESEPVQCCFRRRPLRSRGYVQFNALMGNSIGVRLRGAAYNWLRDGIRLVDCVIGHPLDVGGYVSFFYI